MDHPNQSNFSIYDDMEHPLIDIHQPHHKPTSTNPDNKLSKELKNAISQVAQTRTMLQTLGERPDHELVDKAKAKVAEIDTILSEKLEQLVLMPRPDDIDLKQWRKHLAERESVIRKNAEAERELYKSVIVLNEMHEMYGKVLSESEEKLVRMYGAGEDGGVVENGEEVLSEEVLCILKEVEEKGIRIVDLSGKGLSVLPEIVFGRLRRVIVLNLANNQLQMIPDALAWLETLEELNLSSNQLESLPDSIGLLQNLKFLNVSGNLLTTLPDSIQYCRALIELDASYNQLTFLPTNIGLELNSLRRLSVQMNKIRALPSSICEMTSLRFLDAHFNELHGLPVGIGKLCNLEVLDLSSNFSDLTQLPDTFCDLIKLRELNLSNNQIHALPNEFGRLENLTKLNLDQNPIVTPPPGIADQGAEAVKSFMARRWVDLLDEEERRSMDAMKEQRQAGWLNLNTSWLNNVASGITGTVSEYLSSKTTKDASLDKLL